MVDLQMNCDETENGWFDVKAYLTLSGKSFLFLKFQVV